MVVSTTRSQVNRLVSVDLNGNVEEIAQLENPITALGQYEDDFVSGSFNGEAAVWRNW